MRVPVTFPSLADFLEAQIAEDEQAARASQSQHWTPTQGGGFGMLYDEHERVVIYDEGQPSMEEAAHMARWDPARVLAECEAKRAIIAWNTMMYPMLPTTTILAALALPYADRPGYRDEWRP